jgi:hypothetical protein
VTQVSAELCRGMKYHMTIPREMPLVIMDASSHAAGQARHRFGPLGALRTSGVVSPCFVDYSTKQTCMGVAQQRRGKKGSSLKAH